MMGKKFGGDSLNNVIHEVLTFASINVTCSCLEIMSSRWNLVRRNHAVIELGSPRATVRNKLLRTLLPQMTLGVSLA